MKTTLYHRRKDGSIKVWSCSTFGPWVISEWGQYGGKMSKTKDLMVAKNGDTAWERARDEYRNKVTHRMNKGYVRKLDDVVSTIRVGKTMDFNRLPKSFAPAKPYKQVDMALAKQWDEKDLLHIQRKRDGMRHYVVSGDDGTVRVFSSGKNDVTEHLRPLIKGIELLPRTFLDCELVVTSPAESKDEFLLVSGIARSLPDRARTMIAQAQKDGCLVQLMAFDLLWHGGRSVWTRPYAERYDELRKILSMVDSKTVVPMPNLKGKDLEHAIFMVQKKHWEGLVLWRKDQATMVQLNGSPDRRNCYKVKLAKEEDVVALGFEKGRGKNLNVVGKFKIALASRGTIFKPMGRCGTGLDDETRAAALKWKYPCVIQIEYDSKSEKGFRFPVFIRKRDDKKPSECKG